MASHVPTMARQGVAVNHGNRLIDSGMWTTNETFRELGGVERSPSESWEDWTLRKIIRQDIWTRLIGCACCDFGRFVAKPVFMAQMFLLGIGGPGVQWYAEQIRAALDEFENVHWLYRWTTGPEHNARRYGVVWPFVIRNRYRWAKASPYPPVPSEAVRDEARRRELPMHTRDIGPEDMSYEKFESLQTWGSSMDAWSRAHPEYVRPRGRPAKRGRGLKEFEPPES